MRLIKKYAEENKSKHEEFVENVKALGADEDTVYVAENNLKGLSDEKYDIMIRGVNEFSSARGRCMRNDEMYELKLAQDEEQMQLCFDAYIEHKFTSTKLNFAFQQAINNLFLKKIRRPVKAEDIYEVIKDWDGKW